MRKVLVFCLFAIVVVALPANARVFRSKAVKLVVKHTTATVEAQNAGGVVLDTTSLQDAEPLEVRVGQEVRLSIADSNPLLFKYDWGPIQKTDNTSYQAILAFAKSLQSLKGLLSPSEKKGGEELGVFRETRATANEVGDLLDELRTYVTSFNAIAQQSIDDVGGAQKKVNEWKLEEIETSINDFFDALDKQAAVTLKSQRSAKPKDTEAEKKKSENKNDDDVFVIDDGSGASSQSPLSAEQIRSAERLEPKFREMLEKAKSFRSTVRSIGHEISSDTAVPYDAAHNSVVPLKITANPEFAKIAAESGRKTGEFKLTVEPYYGLVPAYGAAPIYSFVDAPEFSAEKQTDGTLKIAKKDSDYVGMNVSAMLSLVPRTWADDPINVGFQVGVSPVKNQIGFFGGVQLHFLKLASFGVGYGYQQVKQLAGGLAVGNTIAKAEDLKTEPHYTGGWYVGITVELPK